jgi:hypothetical protein
MSLSVPFHDSQFKKYSFCIYQKITLETSILQIPVSNLNDKFIYFFTSENDIGHHSLISEFVNY